MASSVVVLVSFFFFSKELHNGPVCVAREKKKSNYCAMTKVVSQEVRSSRAELGRCGCRLLGGFANCRDSREAALLDPQPGSVGWSQGAKPEWDTEPEAAMIRCRWASGLGAQTTS